MKRNVRNTMMAMTAVGAIAAFGAACSSSSSTGTGGAGTTSSTTGTGSTTTGTGSTSTGMMADCSKLCTTYGAAVPKVASDIVDKAAADPEFKPFFDPLVAKGAQAVADFKTSLANFISDAYKCTTGKYTGKDMATAHMGLNITQKNYDDFITLIAGVLKTDGVADADITGCFAPPLTDKTFESSIIGK